MEPGLGVALHGSLKDLVVGRHWRNGLVFPVGGRATGMRPRWRPMACALGLGALWVTWAQGSAASDATYSGPLLRSRPVAPAYPPDWRRRMANASSPTCLSGDSAYGPKLLVFCPGRSGSK